MRRAAVRTMERWPAAVKIAEATGWIASQGWIVVLRGACRQAAAKIAGVTGRIGSQGQSVVLRGVCRQAVPKRDSIGGYRSKFVSLSAPVSLEWLQPVDCPGAWGTSGLYVRSHSTSGVLVERQAGAGPIASSLAEPAVAQAAAVASRQSTVVPSARTGWQDRAHARRSATPGSVPPRPRDKDTLRARR